MATTNPQGSSAAHPSVEVDEHYDDVDESGIDTGSTSSSTTSISSSVFDYTYENGRRYHSARFSGEYFMPNDEKEQERLDLYHHIFLLMLGGKLHIAPLEKPQRALDAGTGTGIWAIDFADENEQAEVIGIDLSPIQPVYVPTNLKFQVDDLEEEWTFPKNHFDFIHFRALCGCFKDWDAMIKRAYSYTAPGGWVECQEYGCEVFFSDGTPAREKTPFAKFASLTAEAGRIAGRELVIARTLKGRFEKAGFEDITQKVHVWPIGDWPKDKNLKNLGRYAKVGMLEGLQAYSIGLLTKYLKWKPEEVEEFCDEVRADLSQKSPNKYFVEGWFVCGRKPSKS